MCRQCGGGTLEQTEVLLTLYSLQLGATEGHGQVQGDEVFVVTQVHEELKLHFCQHLRQKHTRVWGLCTQIFKLLPSEHPE